MNNKQKVIAKLKGDFVVSKVIRTDYVGEPAIKIKFSMNGQEAECVYTFFGEYGGIEDCSYTEKGDEDIYAEITKWVDNNIDVSLKVKQDGKDVKWA